MNHDPERGPGSTERKLFGQHETIELPVDSFVRLPQVRSGMNPKLPDLKESLKTHGLLNPVDVARMTDAQLSAYIAFVNGLWGTNVRLEEYGYQQQTDGFYYVVVAGHTRIEAIHQLQKEDEAGFEYAVVAKVHPIDTPDEIISLQLDENIHSEPAQEQRAIAVVETYQYGLQNGLWASKADFLRKSQHKFSLRILNEAMGFAQLPPEARDFVFSGRISYNAGVALGQASDTVLEYNAIRLWNGTLPTDEQSQQDFNTAYRETIGRIMMEITNRSLNGTAAKKYIAGQVAMMKSHIQKVTQPDEEPTIFDYELMPAADQAAHYLKELAAEYRAALSRLGTLSIDQVTKLVALHRQLSGDPKIGQELEVELATRRDVLGPFALDLVRR